MYLVIGASWKSMAGQLLVSGFALINACQDVGLRLRLGAVFWFLISMAFGISALVTAIRSNIRYAPAICVVVLCSEILLMLRWMILRFRRNKG
jgi:hypothetical protein